MKAAVEKGRRKAPQRDKEQRVQMLGQRCMWVDMDTALTPSIFIYITLFNCDHFSNLYLQTLRYIVQLPIAISPLPQRQQHFNTVYDHLLTFPWITYISLGLQQ